MDQDYNSAKQFAEQGKKALEVTTKNTGNTNQVPAFDAGAASNRSAQLKNKDLSQQSMLEKQHNEAAQSVETSEKERIKYKHIEKEPLVTNSQKVADNPERILSQTYKDCREVIVEDRSSKKEERKTCEESGDPEERACFEDLIVTRKAADPISQTFRVSFDTDKQGRLWALTNTGKRIFNKTPPDQAACVAEFNRYWTGIDAATGARVTFIPGSVRKVTFVRQHGPTINVVEKTRHSKSWYSYTQFSEYEIEAAIPQYIFEEKWQSNCSALEQLADQGHCSYHNVTCTQGAAWRNIGGENVHKPCWQRKYTYMCQYPSKNNCETLRNNGCEQQNATCKTWKVGRCVEFNKTFLCKSYTTKEGAPFKTKLMCGDTPYCLTANCLNSSYDPNDEMGQALAHLSIFNQMQKKFSKNSLKIFEGDKAWCHKDMLGFCDCCGHGNGWGVSLNMAKCSGDERILAQKRHDNLCHRIGTYCAHKNALGFCEKKRTTFCCFSSKLIRTIQEQGRAQIGKNWGDPKNPNCSAFTIDEFVRIDFSKLDLSEFIQEVMASCKKLDLTRMTEKVHERVGQMQKSLEKGQQ